MIGCLFGIEKIRSFFAGERARLRISKTENQRGIDFKKTRYRTVKNERNLIGCFTPKILMRIGIYAMINVIKNLIISIIRIL
jgi:hypothetical protein